MKLWKKASLVGSLFVLGCGLSGCSIGGNLHNDYSNHNSGYVKPAKHEAHSRTIFQPVTVDFYDSSHPDALMKQRVNNYLSSIKNPQDYSKPQFKTTDVSLDSNHNGNQGETVYIIMHRK